MTLDGGIDMGVGADRPGDLPDLHDLPGPLQPRPGPPELRVPQGELQPEGHRLGVHAVRPSDHRGVPMIAGPLGPRLDRPVEVGQYHPARLPHLQRQRRIEHVGRREPEMQPASRRADLLGHRGRERDDVMLRGLLDLVDAFGPHAGARRDIPRRRLVNEPGGGHRVGRRDLDPQPGLVLALVAPDATHLGVGIAWNHDVVDT